MESMLSLLNLYKKEKITDYVLEKELATYFDGNVRFELTENSRNNNNMSYVAFIVPEKLVEGFVLTVVLDKFALKALYTDEEFVEVLMRLKKKVQKILRLYNKFIIDNAGSDVSFNTAVGFLLALYSEYRGDLIVEKDDFLPEEDQILKLSEKFVMSQASKEDLEKLFIDNTVCSRIVELAKKYVKVSDEVKVVLKSDTEEKPVFNLWQGELYTHSTSTFGVRNHKELPYDYLPKTNQ